MRAAQIAQHADDLHRATAFYTALLGAPPTATFDPPGLVFFDLDGQRLLLDRGAPSALLYFLVDDVTATVDRLRASGTPIETEPHVIFTHHDATLGPANTEEVHAFIRDTENNLVGLIEHRPL
ncbi:VOC family protein [Paractinoplanes atraurantiacus]|uniref:Methylmalonyl-CoA/ethylmalonyl-CoA epimerase n=1 Tax=Paractinoplanes atraurantiacus TaxID=1036182 RepID=A0A285J1D2_9ACTN|nr:VOC family protein [Actinoplanes atraurantiacus]SNY54140.1 methylmalonyl-CoA/ethylmalonyl-CoA epimerase [Actinoplanes atraurantiacus]